MCVVVDGSRNTERKKPREAADDSVSGAEDIALKDTTRDPERLSFKAGKRAQDFHFCCSDCPKMVTSGQM